MPSLYRIRIFHFYSFTSQKFIIPLEEKIEVDTQF